MNIMHTSSTSSVDELYAVLRRREIYRGEMAALVNTMAINLS